MTARFSRSSDPKPAPYLASGFEVSGSGLSASLDGLGELMIIGLLGAFAGLIVGLLFAHVARWLSMCAGKSFGGYSWAICGMLLGMVLAMIIGTASDEG